jgi:hypothetical protein
MDRRAEVDAWLAAYVNLPSVRIDPDDIIGSLTYAGDDAHEVMQDFARVFSVDMSAFNPWHHYDADEPPGWARYRPVGPDGKPLPLLPIGLDDLTQAADAGRWQVSYQGRTLRHVSPLRRLLWVILFGGLGAAFLACLFPG